MFQLLGLTSALDRICANRLAPLSLSEGKFVLLSLLRDLPGELAPFELAERTGVTRAEVTGLLDGLEPGGLLKRYRENDEDRRMVSVRLTDEGQGIAAEAFETHIRWIASLFAGMDDKARDALSSLLRHVRRNVETSPDLDARIER